MSAKAITLDGLGTELKQIESDLGAATLRGLRVAAEGLRAEAIRQMAEVKPYQPMDTGALRRGWETVNHHDGATVQNLVSYAGHMEFGTRPHWAPIEPLRKWATRKLRGKATPRKGRERSVEGLARAAQRSIARHGIKGRFFWREALKKLPMLVETSIDRELKRVR